MILHRCTLILLRRALILLRSALILLRCLLAAILSGILLRATLLLHLCATLTQLRAFCVPHRAELIQLIAAQLSHDLPAKVAQRRGIARTTLGMSL